MNNIITNKMLNIKHIYENLSLRKKLALEDFYRTIQEDVREIQDVDVVNYNPIMNKINMAERIFNYAKCMDIHKN